MMQCSWEVRWRMPKIIVSSIERQRFRIIQHGADTTILKMGFQSVALLMLDHIKMVDMFTVRPLDGNRDARDLGQSGCVLIREATANGRPLHDVWDFHVKDGGLQPIETAVDPFHDVFAFTAVGSGFFSVKTLKWIGAG